MLTKKPIENVLFLDIETTSQYPRFEDMPVNLKVLFLKRFAKDYKSLQEEGEDDAITVEKLYNNKAPLYAEWGKIVCISVLRIKDPKEYKYSVISFYGEDEKELINSFLNKITTVSNCESISKAKDYLCAHNGINFDFPFIAKRMIINGITPPVMFDFAESKPWDLVHFIDTKVVWKYGVYDNNVSLDLLCSIFGVKSSKTDFSGEMVKDAFWIGKEYKKIADYCEQDVLALASCYLKMKGITNQLTK